MKKKYLFVLWGGLFVLCAGLGFLPEPAGAARIMLTALSVVFFLPPAWLLGAANREDDRGTCLLVRNLALCSLCLTVAALIGNVVFAVSGETLGTFLHGVLVVVSSPMVCSGYWALSLFLWACLLLAAGKLSRKK